MKVDWGSRWYWLTRVHVSVTIHLDRNHHYLWTRLVGVRIGSWWFGAIQGTERE